MIPFYAPKAKSIVDVTCNERRIWAGTNFKVLGIDIDERVKPDIVADFNDLRDILPKHSVDLVIFDPPHLSHRSSTLKSWNSRFGLKVFDEGWTAVSKMFEGFFKEASRYMARDGIVFAKICDPVNGRKYHWQHIDLILAGRAFGFTPCDLIVKTRKNGVIRSSRWIRSHHARKHHSFWIIFRNGKKCQ